ncbi:hypothetical protein ANCDUO_08439 [Ancylostoma duodenale]|uniref:Uncharacterized protein n=1 Tax=Ancylostoma duodenale TaxID=51022 RepID=A0A0C2GJB3_9BILA|nr:hypothetical protein ANCDUO_08439 [Ancylostoma duodenale]
MIQAREIMYDIIEMTAARREWPLNATFDTCPHRHDCGHEHRLVRAANSPDWMFATEKIWIKAGLDILRRLHSNIQLRQRQDLCPHRGLAEV